ncbi:MAG: flagellar hook-associated protein FlgK [Lachnospiraceae bacterium]|nr:flagellar hook-associated protein FlgK [Lachnospiraceae bacterium]
MSLFGALHVGQSGISTSNNALNTTAHNLSNIETEGYVRQQVLQSDRVYHNIGSAAIAPKQSGLGVVYSKVRQVRDEFLDAAYRKEAGRENFYSTCYEVTNELEVFLGELQGASFKDSLTNLWTAVEELQKDPSSGVTEGQFVSQASQFLERAQAVYQGLSDYQDNLNEKIKDMVDTINEYGQKICDYNSWISKIELSSEEANDLRDARNKLLDELGAYGNLTYKEDIKGEVTAIFEGVPFVNPGQNTPFKMDVGYMLDDGSYKKDRQGDPSTGFYTPIWPAYGNTPVFDVNQEISSKKNTNIGELKALVLARGDRRADYTDVEDPIYNEGSDKLASTANSIIMNAQAEFDQLIHKVVTEVNNILTGEKDQIDSGKTPSYSDEESEPKELFVRLGTERYTSDTHTYIPENTLVSQTMYSCKNLKINQELLKEPTLLGYPDKSFTTADKNVDQTKADRLAEAFSTAGLTLNPNVTKESNFVDLYSDMVGAMGTAGYIYKTVSDSQNTTVGSIDSSRQQIMGVSSNEELQNMIKFQNAFNASSRYFNTINEMIDHILNRLGG